MPEETQMFTECDTFSGNTLIVFSDKPLAMRYLEHRAKVFGATGLCAMVEDTRTLSGLCVLWRDPVALDELESRLANCRWLLEEVLSGRQPRPEPGVVSVLKRYEPEENKTAFKIPSDLPFAALKVTFYTDEPSSWYQPRENAVQWIEDDGMEHVERILADTGMDISTVHPVGKRAAIVYDLLDYWYDQARSKGEALDERINLQMQSRPTCIKPYGLANVIAIRLARRAKERKQATDTATPLPAGLNAKEALLTILDRIREQGRRDGARLAEIVSARLGLQDAKVRSLSNLAAEYTISTERVRQIEAKAIRLVRYMWHKLGCPALDEVKAIAESSEPLSDMNKARMRQLCATASIPQIVAMAAGASTKEPIASQWKGI